MPVPSPGYVCTQSPFQIATIVPKSKSAFLRLNQLRSAIFEGKSKEFLKIHRSWANRGRIKFPVNRTKVLVAVNGDFVDFLTIFGGVGLFVFAAGNSTY